MDYGFFAVLPSLVAIVLAVTTRRVLLSLLLGLVVGGFVLSHGHPVGATKEMFFLLQRTLQRVSNVYVLLFTFCMGAVLSLIQHSGGMTGFVAYISRRFPNSSPRFIQGLAATLGGILFIETNLSILTVGTLFRPIFDSSRISREKLAYLCDSTSAPACILFPFNAWGAYLVSILVVSGFENPLWLLVHVLPFNFYPILTLGLLFMSVFFRFEIGPMRRTQPIPLPTVAEKIAPAGNLTPHQGVSPLLRNMLLPIFLLLLLMPCFMVYTGWDADDKLPFFKRIGESFIHGDGMFSVLLACFFAMLFAVLLYRRQNLFSLKVAWKIAAKGAMGMWTLAALMLLAFMLGDLCKTLHTGDYLTTLIQGRISPTLLPATFFVLSAIISFSTGTSWGTFAIALALVMPMCVAMDAPVVLCIAAVLGGGIFGDHCSPISDTTLISSLASGCSHMSHVRTQLPYALLVGAVTLLLYIAMGFVYVP